MHTSYDKIIIGEGKAGCSWVRVPFKEEQSNDYKISENNVSYYLHGLYLDTTMLVFKNTDEGKEITKKIEHVQKGNLNLNELHEALDDMVLRNMSFDLLKTKVKDACQESFSLGSEAKRCEINSVLGISDNRVSIPRYLRSILNLS